MSTGPDELTRFLRKSLERKIPRPEIERALVDAGWQPHQAQKALSDFAEVDFPVPVPRPARQFSAGQAFAYLVLFSALATAGFSIVELIFRVIEWRFPDPAVDPSSRDYWERAIRWSVARVVIALPVFLFAARGIARMLDRDPTQRHSPVRRWLTYLAMFVAVCVLIGDFVTLVAWMLGGETTIRFLLKVATVAIAAGAVLAYYLSDLRSDDESGPARRGGGMALAGAATVVAILAVAAGLWLVGSPAEQAARRIDDRRADDLRSVTTAVNVYFDRNGRLPDDLAALVAGLDAPLATADPATGEAYEYRTTGTNSYELCARFSRPSRNVQRDAAWTHGAGRQCFTLKIDEKESQ